MKQFDYKTLHELTITPEMAKKIETIGELRGQLHQVQQLTPPVLARLIEVAKIQSTDASNRIEGVFTSDTRLRQLVAKKTTPHNRSEEEISGYRDVLDLIHQNHAYIPITSNSILALHKRLFSFTASRWGGHFKDSDNQIITQFSDGTAEVRFTPASAVMTPPLIAELCQAYQAAHQAEDLPLLLICGAFVFDFVSIHPFRDGNGRMSRLLMLLVLYQSGYDIGRYISLEALIERTKANYYETLKASSVGWAEQTNDYQPFLNYFLSVVLQAYRQLSQRVKPTDTKKTTAPTLIENALQAELRPLSKRDLMALIPNYSQTTIERGLRTLMVQGKIEKLGQGRATKYALKF
ncbi:MAG: Fic family protein [Lactobacillus sp.]|nr:Fic family protein [Lactobacillus sp.]